MTSVPSTAVGGAAENRYARPIAVVASLCVLLAAAAIALLVTGADARGDAGELPGSTAQLLTAIRWPVAAVIAALAAVHYLAAAVAMRAAAGVRTPMRETILVQLSAATANRLTPAGLGGSAVLARYLTRRAGFELSGALGAAFTLSTFGALADLIVLILLASVGGWFGLSGGGAEVATLLHHVGGLLTRFTTPWFAAAAVIAGGTATAVLLRRRARADRSGRLQRFCRPLVELRRRPRSLVILMTASAGTTVALGFAFAASCAVLPGPQPHLSVGGLVIAYMIGAAAAGAVPVPAGIGATETAMTALLVSAQVPAAHALADVLAFRVVTFWLPAAVGILATRRLYRTGAL
jgi:uncharacterized membrane protein YbhN (UPF0104 family)